MISDLVHARTDDAENPTLDLRGSGVARARDCSSPATRRRRRRSAICCSFWRRNPRWRSNCRLPSTTTVCSRASSRSCCASNRRCAVLSRMTTREVELGGKVLPKGAHMLLLYASANDDEKEFPCPRNFDVNRGNMAAICRSARACTVASGCRSRAWRSRSRRGSS